MNNAEQSIFSFVRKGNKEDDLLVFVCNFTPAVYHDYIIGVPQKGSYREVLNTDALEFGGSGVINERIIKTIDEAYHGKANSIVLSIPPFGVSLLRLVNQGEESRNDQEKMCGNVIGRRKGK